MDVNQILTYFLENLDSAVGIITLFLGACVAGVKGIFSVYAFISSSKLEVALMNKKEQIKFYFSNFFTSFIALSSANCLLGYVMQKNIELNILNVIYKTRLEAPLSNFQPHHYHRRSVFTDFVSHTQRVIITQVLEDLQ